MAVDPFPGSPQQSPGASNPANDGVPVVPDDANDLATGICSALMIGVAGTLKVTTRNGNVRTYPGVPAGLLPLRVVRVWAIGTSATNIIALYH